MPNMTNPDKRSGPLTPVQQATYTPEEAKKRSTDSLSLQRGNIQQLLDLNVIDPRCAAIANTKLEEAELWIREGIRLAAENEKAEPGT